MPPECTNIGTLLTPPCTRLQEANGYNLASHLNRDRMIMNSTKPIIWMVTMGYPLVGGLYTEPPVLMDSTQSPGILHWSPTRVHQEFAKNILREGTTISMLETTMLFAPSALTTCCILLIQAPGLSPGLEFLERMTLQACPRLVTGTPLRLEDLTVCINTNAVEFHVYHCVLGLPFLRQGGYTFFYSNPHIFTHDTIPRAEDPVSTIIAILD